MPGYTGHIKGIYSENLFSNAYGPTTVQAFAKKHPIGHDVSPKVRFKSQTQQTYKLKNFRRFSKSEFICFIC